MPPKRPLPGFRDFYPEDCVKRDAIFKVWKKTAENFNFLPYDAPILEPLEVYTQKSGEEIVGQLFTFTDQGGRKVALRPEMTPSLAYMVGQKINSLSKPLKWFHIGEHYRYERPQKGRLRAFYQLNCDILGDPSPLADAELISLLVQTLKNFGLKQKDFKIRLSDRELWMLFLSSWASDPEKQLAILGIVDKIERRTPEVLQKELSTYIAEKDLEAFWVRLQQFSSINTLAGLQSFFKENNIYTEAAEKRLMDWKALLDTLEAFGISPYIEVDFRIVRGLAYYTGFVFEAFQREGIGRSIAGGGRYDNLLAKLGAPGTPATGFGMGDVTLADFLEEKGLLTEIALPAPQIYVAYEPDAPAVFTVALQTVSLLRSAGYSVEYSFKTTQKLDKQLKQAKEKGANYALIFTQADLNTGKVTLKQFEPNLETPLVRETLLQTLEAQLQSTK